VIATPSRSEPQAVECKPEMGIVFDTLMRYCFEQYCVEGGLVQIDLFRGTQSCEGAVNTSFMLPQVSRIEVALVCVFEG